MTTPMKLAAKRALMRRLWNEDFGSCSDIAAAVGADVDGVAKWLASQPGYPGLIAPRQVTCSLCAVEFPTWRNGGNNHYCSTVCRAEMRRQAWFKCQRRKRGLSVEEMPPRKSWRGMRLTRASRRVIDKARREARERGTTRDAVLAEWKFVPERSTTP